MEQEGKRGRPSMFSQEIADHICEQIATTSRSLKTICADEGMPSHVTILKWLTKGSKEDGPRELQDFLTHYIRAREAKADLLAEEITEIADRALIGQKTKTDKDGQEEITIGDNVERSRLMVDARKWAAAKLAPKKYGDKIEHQHSGFLDNRPPWLTNDIKNEGE